jgi:glycosyltransferase involved in cell wall biosynthesis
MKIAIIAPFKDFNPAFSLSSIVADQIRMLTEYGHEVDLIVDAHFNREKFPNKDIERATIRAIIPHIDQVDYQSNDLSPEHKRFLDDYVRELSPVIAQCGYVFTHDCILTGWFLPYGLGNALLAKQHPMVVWMHWVHSIPDPSNRRDWWDKELLFPSGTRHKIIYPNETDRMLVAERYGGDMDLVRVIPHIRDIRTLLRFTDATCAFIKRHPHIIHADIVQAYPASSDRLSSKGVDKLIKLFGRIKQLSYSVCLIIANQWATSRQRKEDIQVYKDLAVAEGLSPAEVLWTSDIGPEYEIGIPRDMLVDLYQLSNVFAFPTTHESFGLVLPEAMICGAFPVLNRSLPLHAEIMDGVGLYYNFGSFSQHVNFDMDQYLWHVAASFIGRWQQNEGMLAKSLCRQKFNWDEAYRRDYMPIMAEASVWA